MIKTPTHKRIAPGFVLGCFRCFCSFPIYTKMETDSPSLACLPASHPPPRQRRHLHLHHHAPRRNPHPCFARRCRRRSGIRLGNQLLNPPQHVGSVGPLARVLLEDPRHRLDERGAVGMAGREGHTADYAEVGGLDDARPEGLVGEVALEGGVAEGQGEEEAAEGPDYVCVCCWGGWVGGRQSVCWLAQPSSSNEQSTHRTKKKPNVPSTLASSTASLATSNSSGAR